METNGNSTARVITILDYLGILCLLGLFIEKDNEDVKFHTNQGLILFILEVLVGAVGGAISFLLGFIGTTIVSLLGVFCLVLAILGIVNAVNGRRVPLPVIGGLFTFIR